MIKEPVRFGDTVYIQFRQSNFVVCASGFYNSHIWAGSQSLISTKAFRNCLFQIYPRQISTENPFTQDYEKQIGANPELSTDKSFELNTVKNSERGKMWSEMKDEKNQQDAAKKVVETFNKKEVLETEGKIMNYSSKFLLRHVESGYFLDIISESDPLNPNFICLKLSHDISLEDYFMFHPKTSLNDPTFDLSDIVTYSDNFFIYSPFQKIVLGYDSQPKKLEPLNIGDLPYLNGFNGKLPLTIGHREPAHIENRSLHLVGGADINYSYLVTLHRYSQGMQEQDKQKNILNVGDYLRFNHEGKYLTLRYLGEGAHQSNHNQLLIGKANDELSVTVNKAHSIFQVVKYQEIQEFPRREQVEGTIKLEKDESEIEEAQGPKLVLRHLLSGRVLAVSVETKKPIFLTMEDLKNNKTDYIAISFVQSGAEAGYPLKMKSEFLLRFSSDAGKSVYLSLGNRLPSEDQHIKSDLFYGLKFPDKYFNEKLPKPTEYEVIFEEHSTHILYAPVFELVDEQELKLVLETQNLFYQFAQLLRFFEGYKTSKLETVAEEAQGKSEKSLVSNIFGGLKSGLANVERLQQNMNSLRQIKKYITDVQGTIQLYLSIQKSKASLEEGKNSKEESSRALRESRVLDTAVIVIMAILKDKQIFRRLESELLSVSIAAEEFSPNVFISLLKQVNELLLDAINSNQENRLFLSQFLGVFISVLLESEGIYKLANDESLKQSFKNGVTAMIRALLASDNAEALLQIQESSDTILKAMFSETEYQVLLLNLLRQVLAAKPEYNLTLREKFTQQILDEKLMQHIFPNFILNDKNVICVHYERLHAPQMTVEIPVGELFEFESGAPMSRIGFSGSFAGQLRLNLLRSIEKDILPANQMEFLAERGGETNAANLQLKQEQLAYYLLNSLKLANTLANFENPVVTCIFIRHYPIQMILDIVRGNSACPRDIRNQLQNLIYKVHMKFFQSALDSLPPAIRIANTDEKISEIYKLVQTYLQQSVDKIVSEDEWDMIRQKGFEQQVNITREIFKQWKNGEIQFSGLPKTIDNLDSFELSELSEALTTALLQQGLTKDKGMIETVFQIYKTMLNRVSDELEGDSLETLKLGLTSFGEVQRKHIEFSANQILEKIVDEARKRVQSIETLQSHAYMLLVRDESEPLLEEKKGGVFTQLFSSPASIFEKMFDEGGDTDIVIENPKWIKLKNTSMLLQELQTSSQYFGTSQLNKLFFQIIYKKPELSRLAIRNLRQIVMYQKELLYELNKTEFITNIHQMKKVEQLSQIASEIHRSTRALRCTTSTSLKESTISVFKIGHLVEEFTAQNIQRIFAETSRGLDTLLLMIYNPVIHFRSRKDGAEASSEFMTIFSTLKKNEDFPFKIRQEAIRTDLQGVFYILKLHQIIIEFIEVLYQQLKHFRSYTETILVLIRKSFVLLAMIVAGDGINQRAMLDSSELRQILVNFGDKIPSQAVDGLLLISELFPKNTTFTSSINPPLAKILNETFLKRFSKLDTIELNKVNLLDYTCIIALPKISKIQFQGDMPQIDFGQIVARHLVKISNHLLNNSLDEMVLKKNPKQNEADPSASFKLSTLYFYVVEFLQTWHQIISSTQGTKQNFDLLNRELKMPILTKILKREELLFQFELRKALCQTFANIYRYSTTTSTKATVSPIDLRDLFFILFEDIRVYVHFMSIQFRADVDLGSPSANRFGLQSMGKFGVEPSLSGIRALWRGFFSEKLFDSAVNIEVEIVTLKQLWKEYIYEGCLLLLEFLVIEEADFLTNELNEDFGPKNLIEYFFACEKSLLETADSTNQHTYQRMSEALSLAATKAKYTHYKKEFDSLIDIIENKIRNSLQLEQNFSQIKSFSDNFTEHVNQTQANFNFLIENLETIEENNVEKLSEALLKLENQEREEIIGELMKVLLEDYSEMRRDEISLILKLLRHLIERDIRVMELGTESFGFEQAQRRISELQSLYQSLGLKNIIITIGLNVNDDAIFEEILLLSQAYLYGGNVKIQTEFYEHFKSDLENSFLAKVNRLLQAKFEVFIEKENTRIHKLYEKALKERFEYLEEKGGYPTDDKGLEEMFFTIQKKFPAEISTLAEDEASNSLLLQIIKFFQALCENQFTDLQTFLHEQTYIDDQGEVRPFKKMVNFLELLTRCFNAYYKVHSAYNMSIGVEIVAAITEMIQGDIDKNIETITKRSLLLDITQLISDYNSTLHLLPRGYSPFPYKTERDALAAKEKAEKQQKKNKKTKDSSSASELEVNNQYFMKLKSPCLELLVTIAQYPTDTATSALVVCLDKNSLMKELEKMLYEFFGWEKGTLPSDTRIDKTINMKIKGLVNEDFEGVLGGITNVFVLFLYIWPDKKDWERYIDDLISLNRNKEERLLLKKLIAIFMTQIVTSTEIILDRKENDLIRYWFPILPQCRYLSDNVKQDFLKNVDRSTHQMKILSLMDSIEDFIPEMESEYNLQVLKKGRSTQGLRRAGLVIANLAAIIVNIIYLFVLDKQHTVVEDGPWPFMYWLITGEETLDEKNAVVMIFVFMLVLVNFVFAVINVVLYITTQWKRQQRIQWRHHTEQYREEIGNLPMTTQKKLSPGLIHTLTAEEALSVVRYKGVDSVEFKTIRQMKKDPKVSEIYKSVRKFYWWNSFLFIMQGELIWLLTYAVISFCAGFFTLGSTLLLADIAVRSDALKSILQAVLKNIKQFLWALFLLCFLTLVYTYIAFYLFADRMVTSDGTNLCTDAFQCFMSVLNLGLRNGGGIADAMGADNDTNGWVFAANVLFDLSFFIIVVAVLKNLIFGMIIDAFGDIRDAKTAADEDRLHVCFICGMKRSENRNLPFDEHCNTDHDIWRYVYFVTYLKRKYTRERNEMNGVENYVHRAIQSGQYDWLPEGRSFTYEKIYAKHQGVKKDEKEEMADKLEHSLEELKDLRKYMVSTFTEIRTDIKVLSLTKLIRKAPSSK